MGSGTQLTTKEIYCRRCLWEWVELPRQISAGRYHACAILDDDSAKCWGYNHVGQLGAV